MENGRTEKKIAGAVVAATLAAGMLANGAIEDPRELFPQEIPPEHVESIRLDDLPDRGMCYYAEIPPTPGMLRREKLLKLPLWVRSGILLPLWCIGEGCFALLAVIWSFFGTAPGRGLLGFMLRFGLLFCIFALVYKLIFPNTPIKELLRGKNISWLIICAAGLTAADLLLSVFLKGYTEIRAAVWLLCGGLALALLWHRLCGHLKLPERLKRPVEFVIPEDI